MADSMNYRFKTIRFGQFPPMTPLPKWAIERAGRTVDEWTAMGELEETAEQCVVELKLPEIKTLADPAPQIEAELHRLRGENNRFGIENKNAKDVAEAKTKENENLTRELGKQSAEIARLSALSGQLKAELDELKTNVEDANWLETKLDTVTAPPKRGTHAAAVAVGS